jgi:hypothetical protein
VIKEVEFALFYAEHAKAAKKPFDAKLLLTFFVLTG